MGREGNDSIKNNITSKLVRYTNINLLIFCTVNMPLLFYHYWYTIIVLINILHLFLWFTIISITMECTCQESSNFIDPPFKTGHQCAGNGQLHVGPPILQGFWRPPFWRKWKKVRNEPQSNYFPPSSMKRHFKSECVLNLHNPTNLHTGTCIQK